MSADAPPSYDSIVDKLTKSLGPQPKLEDVYKIREQLPKYEKDVLAAHIYEVPPMTKEEEFKLTLGIAQSMSSEIGHDYLDTEAREVNKAVKEIQAMFNKLNGQLSEVDRQYTSPKDGAFAPRLAKHSNVRVESILKLKRFLVWRFPSPQEYNRILQKSRDLATEIAVYGQRKSMSGRLVPYRLRFLIIHKRVWRRYNTRCHVRKVYQRGKKNSNSILHWCMYTLEADFLYLLICFGYLQKDKKFKEASDQTIKDFAQLKLDFGSFTGQFSSWAKEKKESQNAQLEAIKKELVQMVETLAKRRTELLAIGLATAAVLPVTGIIASFAGPFAPFVIVSQD